MDLGHHQAAGPAKWTYFYLYVILDIFSRYVVGWTVATSESSLVAKALIEEACRPHGIQPDQLTLHADRGSPMVSKPVAFLLADLAVLKGHSRPHVSDDNPFSEAQFKTLKYRPDFPERFGRPTIPGSTAATSSPGTTTSTATPASVFTRRPTSTTGTRAKARAADGRPGCRFSRPS